MDDSTAAGAGTRKLTKALVSFAVETPAKAVPANAWEKAKIIVLDTFGVCLAAAPLPIGRIVSGYAVDAGGPKVATIIGAGGLKTAAPMAALANGTLANALDYNESSHVATHTLPAVLALAEERGLSGQDVLEAFVIGFEAGSRLAQTFDGARAHESGPTYRGWWHVGVLGPVAAAIAAGRLLKLDAPKMAAAIGISTCTSGGFRRNMGTMAKALHSGNAARDGIQAALLAGRGFSADPDIIEAPLGFLAALCNPDERDDAAIAERLGRTYVIEGKPRIKPFPACTRAHKGIDGALAVRAQPGFDLNAIEAVEADLNSFSLLRPEAPDEDAAGFSAAFLIAAALIHGKVGLDQIAPAVLHDPKVRALMAKVGHKPTQGAERVTVRLKGGKVLTAQIDSGRHLGTPDEIEGKYREGASRVIDRAAASELKDLLLSLDRQPNLTRIMELAGKAAT